MRGAPGGDALASARRTARRVTRGEDVARPELAAAVRTSLAWMAHSTPGKLVEVRVPPFAAVQVGVPGQTSSHTRGTPPNVVETDPATWLALASGRLGWSDAVSQHRVTASGAHAVLAHQLGAVVRALAT